MLRQVLSNNGPYNRDGPITTCTCMYIRGRGLLSGTFSSDMNFRPCSSSSIEMRHCSCQSDTLPVAVDRGYLLSRPPWRLHVVIRGPPRRKEKEKTTVATRESFLRNRGR